MPKRDHGVLATSWWGNTTPVTHVAPAANTYLIANIQPLVPGKVAGWRYYADGTGAAPQIAMVWDPRGQAVERVREFSQLNFPSANAGWNQCWVHPWFEVDGTFSLNIGILVGTNGYYRTNGALGSVGVTQNGFTYFWSAVTTNIYPPIATLAHLTNAIGIDLLFYAD